MKKQDLGAIENWIRTIRDHYRLHATQLDEIKDKEERHRKFVELNVVETCMSVAKTGPVQRKRAETENAPGGPYPRIHGLTFDPKVSGLRSILPAPLFCMVIQHVVGGSFEESLQGLQSKYGEHAPHLRSVRFHQVDVCAMIQAALPVLSCSLSKLGFCFDDLPAL